MVVLRYFLFFLLALLMLVLITPPALLVRFLKTLWTRKLNAQWLFSVAVSVDQLINVIAADLFNVLFLKDEKQASFGDEDETISSVIGKNHLKNNLTAIGKALRKIMHFFDKNHAVNSIEKDEGLL